MKNLCSMFAIVVLLIGCQSGARVFTNWQFSEEGYKIFSPYGEYVYEKSSNKSTMIINNGVDEKKFIDYGSDNVVDEVEFKFKVYKRDKKGTEDIFTSADEDWNYYKTKLNVSTVDEKWRSMTPADFARHQGYFKRYSD